MNTVPFEMHRAPDPAPADDPMPMPAEHPHHAPTHLPQDDEPFPDPNPQILH